MLPITLLKAAQNSNALVELKNGDTYNGVLVSCNLFMNIHLRDVVCTSRDGDRFWKINECFIKGNSIKYLRIPDEIVSLVPETTYPTHSGGGRGAGRGSGGRGGGRGEGGRGRGRGEGRGEGRGDGGRGRGRGRSSSAEGRGGGGGRGRGAGVGGGRAD